MRKQFWAVAALTVLALPSAWGQALPTTPTIPDPIPTFRILQTQPCLTARPDEAGFVRLPAGILRTDVGLVGTAPTSATAAGTGLATGTLPGCRFVGSVLCIDPGTDARFTSFAGVPAGAAGLTTVYTA